MVRAEDRRSVFRNLSVIFPTTLPKHNEFFSSYLVVGAGVFGASTTYHLIKKYRYATVILVDRLPYPCPLAASWDWNKVVRADYGHIFYMEKALEAMHFWRTDPLYKPFYYESGYVKIDDTDLGRRMIENYKQLKSDISRIGWAWGAQKAVWWVFLGYQLLMAW
jgi:glycine/D-amino acid oxidase-like deaminating enzyme